jgi:hypothetical protein
MRRSRPNLTLDDFAVEEHRQHAASDTAVEELARDMGYRSIRQMMEQTEVVPLPSGEYVHLTTDSDGYWVAWSIRQFGDIRRFDSRQSALIELRGSDSTILTQS